MKKKMNIISSIVGIVSLASMIYFIVIFCKYINTTGRITVSNSNTYTVYYWADTTAPIVIFSIVFAVVFLILLAACVATLVIVNRTELFAAKESVIDYRKRKCNEREQRKQLKTAKRKAKLLAELDEINRKDKANGDKTDD